MERAVEVEHRGDAVGPLVEPIATAFLALPRDKEINDLFMHISI